MSVEYLTDKDRRVISANKDFLGKLFGYRGMVGRVSASEAVRLINEDLDKWSQNYQAYQKLLWSAKQSLKSDLS